MRISDWSSDVCSSDLKPGVIGIILLIVQTPGLAAECDPFALRIDKQQPLGKKRRQATALVQPLPQLIGLFKQPYGHGTRHLSNECKPAFKAVLNIVRNVRSQRKL